MAESSADVDMVSGVGFRWWAVAGFCGGLVVVAGSGGCTRESTRLALQAQQRADQVQQAVFDYQHEALCRLLYRDLLSRLSGGAGGLSSEQREALNSAWNDRDLIEFWALQQERASALRRIGVDAKLYSDQSLVDLLWKSIEARAERAREGLAEEIGERVGKVSVEGGTE